MSSADTSAPAISRWSSSSVCPREAASINAVRPSDKRAVEVPSSSRQSKNIPLLPCTMAVKIGLWAMSGQRNGVQNKYYFHHFTDVFYIFV